MESQQIIELLLARLDENAKTKQEILLAMCEDMKARLDENSKSKQQILAMMARMEADSKTWREEMRAETESTRAETKTGRK
jgi:outer membrane murein-binding lipoprotein Lpp